jgi:hypothetical protein
MIQIKVQKSENESVLVGEVETLAEARTIVKFLDWLWCHGCLPEMINFYNDETEIVAWEGESCWEYADQDPSGNSDGIWVGGPLT